MLGFYAHNDPADNSLTIQRAIARGTARNARARPFLDPASEGWRVIPPDEAASRQAFDRALGRGEAAAGSSQQRLRQTALYGLARDTWRNLRWAIDGVSPVRDGRRLDPPSNVYRCEETDDYTEAWRLTDRILARLAADVRRVGARLVVFSVPSNLEVEPPPVAAGLCLADPPTAHRLSAILAAHDIPYIDLLPGFREAHEQGAHLFWMQSDLHWTDAGHALAAQIVDDGLRTIGIPR